MAEDKGLFCKKVNSIRWENWAKAYQRVLEHNVKGDIPEDRIFHALRVIDMYLEDRHDRLGEPFFDIKTLLKMHCESTEHKLKTLSEYRKIGSLIHGLTLFGCTKNKSLLLLGELPVATAISKLKTAHNKFRYGYNARFWNHKKDFSKEDFITHNFDTILNTYYEYIEKKPFPASFAEEHACLNKLLEACNEENERMEAFFND